MARSKKSSAPVPSPAAVSALPRLTADLPEAAKIFGVSIYTVRYWVEAGHLRPLVFPGKSRARRSGDRRLKRVLFDVADLQRFIAASKEA